MTGAQTTKTLGTLIILGFAWSVGGLEAWACAGLIVLAVWAEGPPSEGLGGMSQGWRGRQH
jgi:hypothetical protein